MAEHYLNITENATVGATDSNITSHNTVYSWDTPHVSSDIKMGSNIHPRLYFTYLKTKLSRIEERHMKQRMKQLEKLVDKYASVGQEALSDECLRQFIVISRESAMYACGIKLFIEQEHADKFRYRVKGGLKVTPIKNFARPVPKNVHKKLKKCIEKKLFDEYVVFHLDNKAKKETEKEKIKREKDPILFGKVQYSDRYYFIADWEDELDNLRLRDIIKKLSLKRSNISLKKRIDKKRVKKR